MALFPEVQCPEKPLGRFLLLFSQCFLLAAICIFFMSS